MRKIILLTIFIFYSFLAYGAEEIKSVADIFPKASQMKGGSSSWIVAGVSSEKRDRCTVYENTYSYYSTKKEKILDIERENTYMVSARIFECDNFAEALKNYKELAAISKKHAKRKQVAPVPFGEQGIMVALPLQAGRGKSQQANFYVTYIFRNFVIQVYSDDGFAQMDMSGAIESNIYKYLKNKGINYAVNKVNLLVETGSAAYMDSLSFTGDKIASVLISGIVLDANNKPVPNAKITAVETNQSINTDNEGRFNFNVSSGKGKSISMVKTIMLPFPISGEKLALSTGFYPIEVKNNGKDIFNGLLNILVKNNRVSGYLVDTNLNKRFPLTGYVKGDNVALDTDCTEPGSTLNCRKIFKGRLVSDYIVQGKAIGVGSGDFTIDKNKFTVITETPYIRDTGISLKLSVLQNGVQKYSSQNNMPLNAGESNRSYLELQTSSFIGKDMLYFKSAYLKLNVLGLNIKNKAELVLFKRNIDKNGHISMQRIAPLKTISAEDNEEIELDISSQIRQPNEDGYFIGLAGAEKDYIIFNGNTIRAALSYYGDASSYKPRKVLGIALQDFNGDDIVSNKGTIEKDGSEDIVLSLSVSAKGRTLEQLEVTADADTKRVWNTKLNDIYPAIGVLQNGGILNEDDSSIKIPLKSDTEVYDLHLYKGSLKEENINKITVKAIIDGKPYENFITLK